MDKKSITVTITESIRKYLSDYSNAEVLFYLGFILCLFSEAGTQTMFPIPIRIFTLSKMLGVLLIGIKIITFDCFSLASFFLCIFFAAQTLLITVVTGYENPLLWIMLVIGAKNISFRKILKITLIVDISIVLSAFVASALGVIENLQYVEEGRSIITVRNSFGIIYPTDFAAFFSFIILMYFYLKGDTLHSYHYIIVIIIAVLLYCFCQTRLDCTCILLTVIIFAGVNLFERRKPALSEKYRGNHHIIEKFAPFIMPACATFSILITYLYTPSNTVLDLINRTLSGRLAIGQRGLNEYSIKLFGQVVPMNGNGGSIQLPEDYFFIDCSYLYVLLRFGLVFFLTLLAVYMYCTYKNRKNRFYVAAILMVSINCMIAHHLTSFAYNPFPMALFALMTDTEQVATQINPFPQYVLKKKEKVL